MRISLGIALFLGIIMFSCNKPPEACISVDNNSPGVGTDIQLSADCSKHALSYIWKFEGPASSSLNSVERSEEIITVAFDTVGSYTITLEAYQKYSWVGQMSSTTTTVSVN